MAKVRDIVTVVLKNGMPEVKRSRSSNGRRASAVERKDVDRRVMAFAMRHVNGDISRIKAIGEFEIEILPEG